MAGILWIFACLSAYFLKKENPNVEYQFYGIAAIIGLVMGGIQSMSRSTYSRLLPKDSMDNTTYFSFYDVCEKKLVDGPIPSRNRSWARARSMKAAPTERLSCLATSSIEIPSRS